MDLGLHVVADLVLDFHDAADMVFMNEDVMIDDCGDKFQRLFVDQYILQFVPMSEHADWVAEI